MNSLAFRFVVLWGWRRALVAIVCGALSAAAQAPYNLYPILFITFPILIWLIDGGSQKRGPAAGSRKMSEFWAAFRIGWYFGFGYFLSGLSWIGAAFLVQADVFAWMMPFAIVLLPAGLALFTAFGCACARLFWAPGFDRIVVFAIFWVGFEALRGVLFTGFPWNLIGYAFAANEGLSQSVSIFGIYGLSLMTVMIVAAPAALIDDGLQSKIAVGGKFVGPLAMALSLVCMWSYGQFRLVAHETSFVPDVSLRIIQPNILQSEKWKPANTSRIFSRYLELSDIATSPQHSGIEDATHVIWPESALPFLLEERGDAISAIAALLPDNVTLITGAIRRVKVPGAQSTYYNSILTLNGAGEVTDRYDKFHLVPFGEYLPFEKWLTQVGLRHLVNTPGTFSRGSGPVTMPIKGAPPISPLICYEIAFPGAVTARENRPGWIVNLTNDAWFGDSAGPHQHLQQARIRAIEEGLPVVRVANTGISAIIDPFGRVLHRLSLGRSGVIDGALPAAIEPTFFNKWGNMVPFLLILMIILGRITMRKMRERTA